MPVDGWRGTPTVWLIIVVILVPIKVDSSAIKSLEVISAVEESGLHIMRKHEYFTQDVVIIVVPDIIIGKRGHRFCGFDVDDFKAFLDHVSDAQVAAAVAERLAVPTYGVFDFVMEVEGAGVVALLVDLD